MCSNDMTAIGVLREAYDCDISVPGGLSVIGFDDIRMAQFTIPPLTTIQMSQSELARLAFRILINELEDQATRSAKPDYVLTTTLVLRRSTALMSPAAGSTSSRLP